MKKLMETFCKRQGKDIRSLRFFVEGARILPDNTADDLDLEDGDVIETKYSTTGGAGFS